MIPPLSICLRSGPPGWFDDTNIHNIHTYIYTKVFAYLTYLDPHARRRSGAGARIATTNALTRASSSHLTKCQPRAGYLVFERHDRDHGYFPRLFGIRSGYTLSFGIQWVATVWRHEIWGFWTRSSRVEYVYSFIMVQILNNNEGMISRSIHPTKML